MTIQELNILHEKAKTKNDGVYLFKGNYWVVKDKNFIAYANNKGECFKRMGAFNYEIGVVDKCKVKQELKKWLKTN